jgi:hypothetical protein
MNKTVIRLTLAVLLLLACSSTPVVADGTGIPPLCMPSRPCQ